MSSQSNLYGVILAGGSGTRLWPLSTKQQPKQFLSVGQQKSLIGQTASRLKPLMEEKNIWVVCGRNHAGALPEHVAGLSQKQILIEPQAKNTAPALALVAIHLQAKDPNAIMAVLPADHLILPDQWELFAKDLKLAAQVAEEEQALVTFGIPPDHPATGFGYLEQGEKFDKNGQAYFQVKAFHEKPNEPTAQEYLTQGGYYWNSGMFVWQAATFLRELEQSTPAMAQAFQNLAKVLDTPEYPDCLKATFEDIENISVDYAVMERAQKVLMVPAHFAWDDVGSLAAFSKVLPQDASGNDYQGEVFSVDAQGNLVIAQQKPVALVGVQDLVVVEAPQAILILPKDKAQDVKKMVEYLKKLGREDLL